MDTIPPQLRACFSVHRDQTASRMGFTPRASNAVRRIREFTREFPV